MATEEEVGVRLVINGRTAFVADAKEAEASIKGIGRAAEETNVKSRAVSGAFSGLRTEMGALKKEAGGVVSAIGGIATSGVVKYGVGGVALGFTGAASAATYFGLKASGGIEQATMAFTTMLGSSTAATAKVKELQAFAEKTPFNFTGLLDASRHLMAYGYTANQILPTLTAIGDATSGLGGTPETMDSIIRAIGQMRTKGALSAEEINQQLAETGINAWEYLAAAAHKSTAQIQKDTQAGLISGKQAADVIVAGMGNDPRFKGMMDAQSRTLFGLLSNLHDKVQGQLAIATDPLRLLLERNMPWIIDHAGKLATAFGHMLTTGVQIGQTLGAAFKSGGMDGVMAKLGDLTGHGKLFDQIWKHIRDDSRDLANIFRNSLWPALQDVMRAIGPVALAGLWAVEKVLHWMADHPKAARAIFDELAIGLATYKIGSMLIGIAEGFGAVGASAELAGGKVGLFKGSLRSGFLPEAAVGLAGAGVAASGLSGGPGLGNLAKSVGGSATSGAAIGSVVPGVGNVAGGIIGAGVGTFAYDWKNRHDLFGLANGGTINRAGAVMVGERGPEILNLPPAASVTPLDTGGSSGKFGNTYIDLTVQGGDLLEAQKVGRVVMQYIQDQTARQ